MIVKKIADGLNRQVALEAAASDLYLSMAGWCERHKLKGAARFFYAQAEEERAHFLKVVHYLNEHGAEVVLQDRLAPSSNFKSLRDLVEQGLNSERKVTKAVHDLIALCEGEQDYVTLQFVQWFVSEQHEEENVFQDLLDLVDLIGPEGRGLYMIDKEFAGRIAPTE